MSAVFPAVVSEAPVGVEWVHVYTGLTGFLKMHGVEWLFALWAAVGLAGLWLLAQPSIRKGNQKNSRFSPWYAAGIAAALYGVGQTAWYVQQGKDAGSAPAGPLPGGGCLVHGAAVSGGWAGSRTRPAGGGSGSSPCSTPPPRG